MAAAAVELSRQSGAVEPPADAPADEPVRQARRALGPDRARTAEKRGATTSAATTAKHALMPTAPDPEPRPRAGLEKLSVRERELVILVSPDRTSAQIAAQLYIRVHTVSSHLDRIRDKTGCRRRTDLTRLTLSTSLV